MRTPWFTWWLMAVALLIPGERLRGADADSALPLHIFVLDASESMNWDMRGKDKGIREQDRRRNILREGIVRYLDELEDCQVILIVFHSTWAISKPLTILQPEDRLRLVELINRKFGSNLLGTTHLYDTLFDTFSIVQREAKRNPDRVISLYIYSDGRDEKSTNHTCQDLDPLLKSLCKLRTDGARIELLAYRVLGSEFDPSLLKLFDLHKDCLPISTVPPSGPKAPPQPKRWSVAPEEAQLESFAQAPLQNLKLSFGSVVEGAAAKVSVTGLAGVQVLSPRVAITNQAQVVQLRGTVEADGKLGELVLTPEPPPGKQYDFMPPQLRIRLRGGIPPQPAFELSGIEGRSLQLQVGESRNVRVDVNPVVDRVEWTCREWPAPRVGVQQALKFDQPGPRAVRVIAYGKYRGADGQPLSCVAELQVEVVEWGANFRTIPKPIFVGAPVVIECAPVGDVALKWTLNEAEVPAAFRTDDPCRINPVFAQPGRVIVGLEVKARGGTQTKQVFLDVVPKPELRISSPEANAIIYVGRQAEFRVANAAEFRELKWDIAGRQFALPPGGNGVRMTFEAETEGVKTATITGRSIHGGDTVYTARIAFTVKAPPELHVKTPRNYQEFILPPTGEVAVPFELAAESLKLVDRTSIVWVMPQGEQQVEVPGETAQRVFKGEDGYSVTVKAKTLAGEPVATFVHFRTVKDLSLVIANPPNNATVYVGEKVVFSIASPEYFSNVAWEVAGAKLTGANVENILREAGEVTAKVTAEARHNKQALEASVALTVAPPQLTITSPVRDQQLFAGDELKVAATVRGQFDALTWAFLDQQGAKITPEGTVDRGFVFRKPGQYQAQLSGKPSVGQALEDQAPFTVLPKPCVCQLTVTSPAPHYVNRPISFALEASTPLRSITWDFGDGQPPAEGKLLTLSHQFLRLGRHAVRAQATAEDGQTVLAAADLLVVSRGLVAKPVVHSGSAPVTALRRGAVAKLVNEGEPVSDITETSWEHQQPIPARPARLDSPSLTVGEAGVHSFRLTVRGFPDEAGNRDQRTASVLLQVCNWDPTRFAASVLGLVLVGVIGLMLSIRILLGHRPRGWRFHHREVKGDVQAGDPVVYVSEKWRLWAKEAHWKVRDIFDSYGGEDEFIVDKAGLRCHPDKTILRSEGNDRFLLEEPRAPGESSFRMAPAEEQPEKSPLSEVFDKIEGKSGGQGGDDRLKRVWLIRDEPTWPTLAEWVFGLLLVALIGLAVVGALGAWQHFMGCH